MIETLILAITAFAATNIDDLFVDTVLFAGAKTRADSRNIFIGKYLGIGALMLVSMLGAAGMQFLSGGYIRFLGFFPIALGVREAIAAIVSGKNGDEAETGENTSGTLMNTALITMANGADNIGVYIPLFAGFGLWQKALTAVVFAAMIALWCCLARGVAGLPLLKRIIQRYRRVIVPVVYIALGAYILLGLDF